MNIPLPFQTCSHLLPWEAITIICDSPTSNVFFVPVVLCRKVVFIYVFVSISVFILVLYRNNIPLGTAPSPLHTPFFRSTFTGFFLSPLFLLLFWLWWLRLIMWGWVVFAPQTVSAQGQLCPSDSEQPAVMGSASQGKSSGKKINHLKLIDLPPVLKCVCVVSTSCHSFSSPLFLWKCSFILARILQKTINLKLWLQVCF